jgi:hypothetical protein
VEPPAREGLGCRLGPVVVALHRRCCSRRRSGSGGLVRGERSASERGHGPALPPRSPGSTHAAVGPCTRFANDLVRQAVQDSTPVPVRRLYQRLRQQVRGSSRRRRTSVAVAAAFHPIRPVRASAVTRMWGAFRPR